MREIRFKAKAVDNGRWVEGSLILREDYCCILEDSKEIHPMDDPYLDSDLGTFDGRATPVIRETVCQYLNKVDINGVRIYENDIVVRETNCQLNTDGVKGICIFEKDIVDRATNESSNSITFTAYYEQALTDTFGIDYPFIGPQIFHYTYTVIGNQLDNKL